MATETEQLVVALEARVRDFEKNFQRANKAANDNFVKIERRAKQSGDRLESTMAQAASRVGGVLKSFGAGFLGGLAAGGITGIIGEFRQLASGLASIGDEAKRAGVSVKAFQEWKYVAEQNRIGVDALTDGLKEMNLRADEFITTGKGSAADAFQRLGYSAEELKTKIKDPSALMLEIIGRLEQLDKAAQIRISDEIFGGTGGEQFVQLLDRGAESIRATIDEANRLGIVLDEEMIAKADEVDRKFNAISNTVGTALKGAIVEAVQSLQDFINRFQGFQAERDGALDEDLARLGKERLDVERQIMELKDKQSRGEGVGDGLFGTSFGESTHADAKAGLERRMEAIAAEEQMILKVLGERSKAKETAPAAPAQTFTPVTPQTPAKQDAFDREVQKIKERTAAILADTQARRNATGSYAEQEAAIERAGFEQELLNAAQRAGIAITPDLQSNVAALAAAYSAASEEAKVLAESEDEAAQRAQELENSSKDAVKGFLSDLRSGASPIDALINALTRLGDKLLELAFNSIWESIFGDSRGDNFFSNLAKAFTTRSASPVASIAEQTFAAPVGKVERAPLPDIGQATNALSFLQTRAPNKALSHLTGLQSDFQQRLAAMMEAAPGNVTLFSGFRSPERQAQLWQAALAKYGSPEAARKWVAPPGHSMHNEGMAADLGFNGGSFKSMPPDVQAWLHANAGNYGLKFPLGNEPWHIESMETRGGAAWKGQLPGVDTAQIAQQQIEAQRQLAATMQQTSIAARNMQQPIQGIGQAATQVVPQIGNMKTGVTGLIPPLTQATPATGQFGDAISQLLQQLLGGAGGTGGGAGLFGSLFGILGLAEGGHVSGPGTSTSDSIPAMLSDGEFVVNAAATRRHRHLLEAINSGQVPHLASGGGADGKRMAGLAVGGTTTNTFAPSIQVNVEGGSSGNKDQDREHADNIAATVDRMLDAKMAEFMQEQMRAGNALGRSGRFG